MSREHEDPAAAPPGAAAVSMRGITKRFPGVVANDRVDFEAAVGEVHALLGENGAGKSTLSNILTGLYRPDSGQVEIDGSRSTVRSPRDAIAHGIGMVYQHFMLVEPFTVAENVVLGEQRSGVDRPATRGRARGHGAQPALRSRRRSARKDLAALRRGAAAGGDPASLYRARGSSSSTSRLPCSHRRRRRSVATLRGMAAQGFSVVFISHKLDEVMAVADRVTVLRKVAARRHGSAAESTPASNSRR